MFDYFEKKRKATEAVFSWRALRIMFLKRGGTCIICGSARRGVHRSNSRQLIG